jgi:outer membrane receptor protein involved in Fe transport
MAHTTKRHAKRFRLQLLSAAIITAMTGAVTIGAEDDDKKKEEENKVVVTGSQIKGTFAQDALAVTTLTSEEISFLGIESGDELMDLIPENGQNFVNEAENISGGVNSARGDVGAFNLRNLGTGNTLVLFNGRRMVNSAAFQTEEVGGSFVPVNSANSNAIPVLGLDRVEVLRDGASAIYGADAVAGVVNHVMKDNFTGFNIGFRHQDYESIPRNTNTFNLEWGNDFNEGKSNLSVFFNYYERDRVNAQDDPRWANADFRSRVPSDSPWSGDTAFRNDSGNSLFGQFDVVRSLASSHSLRRNDITDSAGEFQLYPIGDPRCTYVVNEFACAGEDGSSRLNYRYNMNQNRDLSSELERVNLYTSFVHDFGDGMESFTELMYYNSKTNLNRHPSAPFTAVKLRVGAQNYYNPFGPCGSPNRLPDSVIGTSVPCEGLEIEIDNYRFAELPRIVDNEGTTTRFLTGLRGTMGEWDYDTALLYMKAEKDDITRNRVSNLLITEALFDPTPNAYNPFCGGCADNNIERGLVDVTRLSTATLTSFDIKLSNSALFEMSGGDAGFLVGLEVRQEDFVDDRDPRLDGTIVFTDFQGDTYPFVSDVVNSSPTPDSAGERDVTSLFMELQMPVFETLDVQAAIRYEDFSDVESTTVGKLAFGWRPVEQLLVRGSWSEAFRAPNLVTINEEIVARNNTRDDYLCQYAAENGGDPDQDILDCTNNIQRVAQGSKNLKPETSENTSVGFAFSPIDDLTITMDWWKIEKDDTIGLFGEENHTILELVNNLQAGNGSCGQSFNPAVERSSDISDEAAAVYLAAGLCPAGDITQIFDNYANLDTRILEGRDITLNYTLDTESAGRFDFRYQVSNLTKFEQQAGGDSKVLVDAAESGVLPPTIPVFGFADLIGFDGNQDQKESMRFSWRINDFTTALTGYRIGSFYQSSLTLEDGTRYKIPSMTRFNLSFTYRFDDSRLRLGINNIGDKRAPLADRYFGYFSDAHTDFGRSMYVDYKHYFD